MSLIKFTKRVFSGETCQDVAFDFGVTDEDPLLAHGVILGFYSPVFAKLINEANNNRDSSRRIQIQATHSDKKTYQAFVNGVYQGFTDAASKSAASKDLFQLVRKYQLPKDLVKNLFSATNVWHCLEFALACPVDSSVTFLLQKCEKMLKINKSVYKDAKALKSIDASTIIHALKQEKLPLKKKEVREFIDLWKEVNKEKENLWEDLASIHEAALIVLERDVLWHTVILNVSSSDVSPFSIEYEPKATVREIVEEATFVTQVEMERICIHQSEDATEIDMDCKKSLKDLGLKEDDEIIFKLINIVTIREMSGQEHLMDFKDDETVDTFRKKVYEKLAAIGNNVYGSELILLKDQNRLEDGKTLLEAGLQDSSMISVVVGRKLKLRLIEDVNIAADAGTQLTASTTSSPYLPIKALPGNSATYWHANVAGASWWCAEFSKPKYLGRLKFTPYIGSCMSFRIEVGNDNQNWTNILTKENERSANQECDLTANTPFKFCRICIDKMGGNAEMALLQKVILNEGVFE